MKFNHEYFDAGLNRMGTRCEKWDMIRQEHGDDILPLWVADMDFPSPPAVQEALLKRAAHPTYGYTEPLEDDYEAVLNYWQRRHGLTLTQAQVSMLPCVVTGLNVCVQALTQPGDGVIIQTPVYGPFFRAVTGTGRVLMENPLVPGEDGRYRMDLEHLESLILQGGKMLILCSPHNPVGRSWSKQELLNLFALLHKHHIPLVVDEIHADFVFKPQVFTPALSLTGDNPNAKVVTLCAASKTFNTAGLQQSYLFTRHEEMKKKIDAFMASAGVRSGNLFALEGTRAALSHGDEWLDGLMEYLDEGRKILKEELARQLPQAVMTPLDATYLAWIDLRAYGFTTDELMERTHKAGVAFTTGTFFGKELGEGFLRFNIGCPHRNIIEGVKRLKKALAL